MLPTHLRQKSSIVLSTLWLGLAAGHAHAQMSASSTASRQSSPPVVLPNSRQPNQPSQPAQQPQSPTIPAGSLPGGVGPMLAGVGGTKHSTTAEPYRPPRAAAIATQALYSGIQQMQLNAQAQAAQQQRAAQLAASQQQSASLSRRRERKADPVDADALFAKPDVKTHGRGKPLKRSPLAN